MGNSEAKSFVSASATSIEAVMSDRMPTRKRANSGADADQAAVIEILTIRDSSALFDGGSTYHFHALSKSLRALCHHGSSGCLLNSIGEKGRSFPSSVNRSLADLSSAASDHFVRTHGTNGAVLVVPRLDLGRADMKMMRFKHWWKEAVITDGHKHGLSRGNLILAIANHEGPAHFLEDVNELYDEIARRNGMGLLFAQEGAWRDHGFDPVKATIRQIAHELLLGMDDWIRQRRADWAYEPVFPKTAGLALAPGVKLHITPV